MERKYVLADRLSGSEIRQMRETLEMSRREFAAFANCSLRTLERWEREDAEVSGPVVTLLEIMARDRFMPKRLEYPAEALRQQAKESAVSDERRSVLAELKASQAEAAKAAEAEARKHRPRLIRDEGAPVRV